MSASAAAAAVNLLGSLTDNLNDPSDVDSVMEWLERAANVSMGQFAGSPTFFSFAAKDNSAIRVNYLNWRISFDEHAAEFVETVDAVVDDDGDEVLDADGNGQFEELWDKNCLVTVTFYNLADTAWTLNGGGTIFAHKDAPELLLQFSASDASIITPAPGESDVTEEEAEEQLACPFASTATIRFEQQAPDGQVVVQKPRFVTEDGKAVIVEETLIEVRIALREKGHLPEEMVKRIVDQMRETNFVFSADAITRDLFLLEGGASELSDTDGLPANAVGRRSKIDNLSATAVTSLTPQPRARLSTGSPMGLPTMVRLPSFLKKKKKPFSAIALLPEPENAVKIAVAKKSSENPWFRSGKNKSVFTIQAPGMPSPRQGVRLMLIEGQTYTFDLTAVPSEHPFFFTTSKKGGNDTHGQSALSIPVSGRVVQFTPTAAMPGVFYFQSTAHPYMGGPVTVAKPSMRAIAVFADSEKVLVHDSSDPQAVYSIFDPVARTTTRHVTIDSAMHSGEEGAPTSGALLCVFDDTVSPNWRGVGLRSVGAVEDGIDLDARDPDQAVQVWRLDAPICDHILTLGRAREWLQQKKDPASDVLCPRCAE